MNQPTPPQVYPGRLRIKPLANLPSDERVKEQILAAIVESPEADSLYDSIPLTHGGMIVNIDLYRELLPEYRLNGDGTATPAMRTFRTKYTAATYAAAKAASLDRFKRKAATAKQVILLGGGPSSGKTLTLRQGLSELDPSDTVVYDTSLTDLKTATVEIRAALSAGAEVNVIWIFRPFAQAVTGMIRRATMEGRYLTLGRMVDLHKGSRQTIQSLVAQMSSVKGLTLTALTSGTDGGVVIPLADLTTVVNNPAEDLSHACAKREFDRFETSTGIPPDLAERLCSGSLH